MIKTKKNNNEKFSVRLLHWFDNNKRNLPWRALTGENPNPYHVYLSEIMLQQTVVKTVIPYFLKFVKKWPTIKSLANANFEEISQYWAGLGYYRRAKNLHETAMQIVKNHGGIIPNNKKKMDGQITLKVQSGFGPEIQMAVPFLINQINARFGYKAISKIKILQTDIGFIDQKEKVLKNNVKENKRPLISDTIKDNELKLAMKKWELSRR